MDMTKRLRALGIDVVKVTHFLLRTEAIVLSNMARNWGVSFNYMERIAIGTYLFVHKAQKRNARFIVEETDGSRTIVHF